MIWFPVKRATLLIPNDPYPKHLNILLTDSYQWHDGITYNLSVSISTLRKNSDTTCLLYDGDHEFIKHDSYVRYKSCQLLPTDKLQKAIDKGIFIPKQPFNSELFARVCYGLEQSPLTPTEILAFYQSSRQ